jgi:hypothetical protein
MRNGHKRMRGRNNNHHHRKSQNPLTRVYESNGPDVKIRGTSSQVAEKYIQLARDAQSSGDPVAAENYYQHAEHYFRVIAAAQEQFRQQNPHYQQQPQQGGAPQQAGSGDENFDGDDEDLGPNGQNEPYNPQAQQQQQNFQPQPQPQNYQPRPQHQPQPQPQSQPQSQPQYNQGGNNPPRSEQEFGGLPSFITGGAQPQPSNGQNGNGQYDQDRNQDRGGQDRFGRHRRRRHRGPRQDFQGQQPVQQGGQPQDQADGGDEPQQSGE